MLFKAVVFDFGGVIFNFGQSSAQLFESLAKQLDVPAAEMASHKKEIWNSFEKCFPLMKGDITAAEFQQSVLPPAIGKIVRRLRLAHRSLQLGRNITKTAHFLRPLKPGSVTLNECMLQLIADLRAAGLKTALLSNCFFFEPEQTSPLLPIAYEGNFDVVVESCRVGSHKPLREIYEITQSRLAALGVEHPSEVLYLDDLQEYCDAGAALGWSTIRVASPEEAVAEARRRLGWCQE